MSAVESLFTSNNTRDPLKSLFAAAENLKKTPFEQISEAVMTKDCQPNAQGDPLASPESSVSAAALPSQSASSQGPAAAADGEGEEPALQLEAKDISNQTMDGSVKIDLSITQDKAKDDAHLSRKDLVLVLETFVNAVMDGQAKSPQSTQSTQSQEPPHENLPSPLNFEPPKEDDPALLAVVEEKDVQINELRTLLVEAQGTIIKLLTDRVEDKAKIATLEAHARYLPDYQRSEAPPEQPSAAEEGTSGVELKEDLTKVKAELEAIQQALKTNAYKNSFDKPTGWGAVKSWVTNFINN